VRGSSETGLDATREIIEIARVTAYIEKFLES
jgi:hypothetical protein